MPTFPSKEWADDYRQRLNENAAYAEAARAWEGDILLLIAPDERAPKGEGVHLDLHHGECRGATYVPDASQVAAEFTYRGSRENWGRMMRREIDPVRAILDGTFKLTGNLMKAMRFQQAAKEMVETATQVPAA